MGRTKELIVFDQQTEARLQYEEMIYEFNKKLYAQYLESSQE